MSLKAQDFYAFGPFRLEPSERVLLRDGTPVSLPPKAFDLLVVLVERAGRLVTKDDLLKEVWQGTFVEEANLSYTVSLLRKALGDDAEPHEYIETVAKRGYRFTSGVRRGDEEESTVEATPRRPALWLAASVALMLLIGFASWLAVHRREPDMSATPARLALIPPPGVTVENAQISPDGQLIAFVGREGDAGKVWNVTNRLWVQRLDATEASPLPGTEGAMNPFWAPDSQHVAFFTSSANSELKKIDVLGGPAQTVGPAVPAGGGSWGRSGVILFHKDQGRSRALYQMPASGGTPVPVTKLDESKQEGRHIWPQFLPDGRHFLYVALTGEKATSGLYVGSLDSSEPKRLLDVETAAIYAEPGYLLYSRGGDIFAQPFDRTRLELSGEATPIAYNREYATRIGEPQFAPASRGSPLGMQFMFGFFGAAIFSVSKTGRLAYSVFEPYQYQFTWFDRSGKPLGDVGSPGPFSTFDLSADGKKVVVARANVDRVNLWSLDLETGALSPVTFGMTFEFDPRWGPGGRRIAWDYTKDNVRRIVLNDLDGKEVIVRQGGGYVHDWSFDGRFLLCLYPEGRFAVPLFGDGKPIPLNRPGAPGLGFDEATFSRNGRLFTYTSAESGRGEVYVERFPPTGERSQISIDGGAQPIWRQDGRELYYLGLDGTLFAADIDEASLKASSPRRLFKAPIGALRPNIEQYATVDGQRFLFLRPDRQPRPINVIINWPAAIKNPSRP